MNGNGSGLASPLYQRLGQRYLARDFAPRFPLGHLAKDLALAQQSAAELGCSARVAASVEAFIASLAPQDRERDYSLLVQRLCEVSK